MRHYLNNDQLVELDRQLAWSYDSPTDTYRLSREFLSELNLLPINVAPGSGSAYNGQTSNTKNVGEVKSPSIADYARAIGGTAVYPVLQTPNSAPIMSYPATKSQAQRMWEEEAISTQHRLNEHLRNIPGATNNSYEATVKAHAEHTQKLRRELTRAKLSLEIIELNLTVGYETTRIEKATKNRAAFTKQLAATRKKLAALR
jgi:hypothetical protein